MSNEAINGMVETINELERELEKYKWIPCSERLPKINHNVLLSTTDGEVFVGYRDKPDLIWQVTEKGDKHWVYDPEAYTDDIDSLPKGEDCGFSRYTGNDYSANGMLSVTSPNYDKRWDSVNAWMPLPRPYEEQTMSDLIEREDAIMAIHNYWKKRLDALPTKESECGEVYADIQQMDKILEHNKILCNFIEAIPSADRPQGEWIPCSERLPNRQGYYICTCKDGSKYKRTTTVKWSNGWQLTGVRAYWIVLAWMPLPEPWKGADDE